MMSAVTDKIEVTKLNFSYGSDTVLQDVDFSLKEGDFAALVGPNGAGKSTLLRLLLKELAPVSGSIRLLGEDVSDFRRWTEIGYVPQNNAVKGVGFPVTVEEIVAASLYSRAGKRQSLRGFRLLNKDRRQTALDALALVGMDDCRKKLMDELSGGQQQRVMLARALVTKPKLMLLDEPTAGVDKKSVDALYELLSRLNCEKGLTIMMVTHDSARVLEYVSRIFCLEQGTLVELSKDQIQAELCHRHSHEN
ncbi:MAG: metal ABC transporter ATP-binding protein [Defluviitaleaceae bacterium]|nr:metal ABC transporter ATP-binding protein [Defluviitaleaceae bacterium]